MPDTLLFDVNETLLDLRALLPHFKRTFGDERVMGQWFGLMLRFSLVATVTRTYRPFDVLGKDALVTTANKHGLTIEDAIIDTILGDMQRLPPHADVIPALKQLKGAGFRLATLTNSRPSVQAAQLEYAGLSEFFSQQFSVAAVGFFKPAPETYHYAASELAVPISDIRMIAAHDWDVTGAIRSGAQAAFVARKGMFLGHSDEIPDIIGPDLSSIVEQLLS